MAAGNVDVDSDSTGVSEVNLSSLTNTDYGKKPKVTLKLKSDENYTFKGIPSGNIQLNDKTGKGATITKISTSGTNLSVTVKLPKTSAGDNGKGSYTVKIRAISSNNSKGNWTESDEFDVDDDILSNLGGQKLYYKQLAAGRRQPVLFRQQRLYGDRLVKESILR